MVVAATAMVMTSGRETAHQELCKSTAPLPSTTPRQEHSSRCRVEAVAPPIGTQSLCGSNLAPTFFWNRSGGRQSRFCRKWALRTLRTRCLRRRTSSCSACAWRTLASGVNGASSSCASDAGVVSGTVRRPELLSRSDLRIDIITCIHVHENKIMPCLLTVKRLGV